MALNDAIKKSIDTCVLCWLASCDDQFLPNVSPKEIFTHYKENYIIIANIASPQTVKNIKINSKVCISFVDVIIQKGFQLKGTATISDKGSEEFNEMESKLVKMTAGKYPFSSITKIRIDSAKPILAPSYLMYPEMDDEERIASAKKAYGF